MRKHAGSFLFAPLPLHRRTLSDEVKLIMTGIKKEYTNVKVFPNTTADYIVVKRLQEDGMVVDGSPNPEL